MCNAKILAQLTLRGTFLKHSEKNDSDTSYQQTAKASIAENCLGAFTSSSLLLQPSILRVNQTSAERQMFQRRSCADELWKTPMPFPHLMLQMCWRMGGIVCMPLQCKAGTDTSWKVTLNAGVAPSTPVCCAPASSSSSPSASLISCRTKHSLIPAYPHVSGELTQQQKRCQESLQCSGDGCDKPACHQLGLPHTDTGTGWHWWYVCNEARR